MTPNEFKIKYPQYSDLEGDALWDKMTFTMMSQGQVLSADPNRKIVYCEPVKHISGAVIMVEDDSTTRWLNSEGEEVKVEQERKFSGKSTTSYRIEIIDFSKL
jgi:hypothetical protein